MIIIRHKTGPLAGTEQRIDGRYERITIGRDPNVCDVVFPPDATLVARRHFALVRRPSGEWTFDLFGDPFVSVNGEPADIGQALHTGAVIELGRHGGPAFEVGLEGEGINDQLPVTDPQEPSESLHAAAGHAEERSARARWIAIGGIAIALAAAVATGVIFKSSRSPGARLQGAIAAFNAAQARAASNTISAAVREKLLSAAYLVTVQHNGNETERGTASPIAADLLATNAHVAAYDEDFRPGDRMFVHAPGKDGRVYEVVEMRLHPAYQPFEQFLKADPFFVSGRRLSGSASYDVATLRVGAGPPLSPILEIATSEELANLEPGSTLALAGYPIERILGREVQALGATPTLAGGMVSAMTDEFHLPADFNHRHLVRHNIPVTGGASGSPIVGPSGRVVAYLNSGNATPGPMNQGRVPNAALINYAQRADLLSDLLSGRAAQTLDSERQYWAQQTQTFKRGFDVLIPGILNRSKQTGDPIVVRQERFSLTNGSALIDMMDENGDLRLDDDGHKIQERLQRLAIPLNGGTPYTFIAYAQDTAFIDLYLFVDGKVQPICGPKRSAVCRDAEDAWYPSLSYTPATDATVEVVVVGPGGAPPPDTLFTFLEYSWRAPGR